VTCLLDVQERLRDTSTDVFNNLMLPDRLTNLRESIHSPCIGGSGSNAKTIDPQSIKQVLCQSAENSENGRLKSLKTMCYSGIVGINRESHMSSHCRYLRTGIMTGGAKLLIAYECAAVAEGRQRSATSSHPNNKHRQHKVQVAYRCCWNAHRHSLCEKNLWNCFRIL